MKCKFCENETEPGSTVCEECCRDAAETTEWIDKRPASQMKTTAKPTPGPWKVHDPETARPSASGGIDNRLMVLHPDCERLICDLSTGYHGVKGPIPESERVTNAELIAEAGTVYHETGLSPRELLDQRDTLSETLKKARAIIAELIRNESCDHAVGICYCEAALAIDMIDAATDLMTNTKKEEEPRFENVGCSQCGQTFGPGDHGFSHCENHEGRIPKP